MKATSNLIQTGLLAFALLSALVSHAQVNVTKIAAGGQHTVSMPARNFSRRVIFFLVANSACEKLVWWFMPSILRNHLRNQSHHVSLKHLKHGALAAIHLDFDPDRLELMTSRQEPLPQVNVFNHIDSDMFGIVTGETRAPGPFGDPGNQPVRKVDPRQISRP